MTHEKDPAELPEEDLDHVTGGLGGLSQGTTNKKTAGLRSDGELVQAVSEKSGVRGVTAQPDGFTDG